MYPKIKKRIISVLMMAVIVFFAGCISDDSGMQQLPKPESDKKDNKTDYVNVGNITEIKENNSEQVIEEKENITSEAGNLTEDKENNTVEKEDKPILNDKPYGEEVIYISHDPVIIYGSLPETQEIRYIKEDKVIFKFLYSSRCPVCKRALPYVPEIKKEFGERVIVEEINIYSKDAEKWRNAAREHIGAENFPFTLSIGMNCLIDNEIKLEFVSYTQGFGGGTYEQWKRNICEQFRDKPENCG